MERLATTLPRPIRNPQSAIRNSASGFTLLEVILALVVLSAALAMLSEVMQLATRHAVESRAETQAQSLACSVMDQLISGAIAAEEVTRQPLEVDDATPWLYSISIGTSSLTGVIMAEVLVEQDLEERLSPVRYRLFRWLPSVRETRESSSPGVGGPGGQAAGGASGQSPGGGASGQAAGGAGGATL
jgi:prepilin-type N-terminal cleavage/methylation domain-containing protein